MYQRQKHHITYARKRENRRRKKRPASGPAVFLPVLLSIIVAVTVLLGSWLRTDTSVLTGRADSLFMDLYSRCAILTAADSDNGSWETLASQNSDRKMYPASLTKIMTALLAVEYTDDFSQTVTLPYPVFPSLYEANASMAGFKPGEEVTLWDLLYGILLPSGAECCLTFAEQIAGSEDAFVSLMNEKAAELGMDSTHFVTCTGLHDENHYTTVRDLTKLLSYALQNDTFRQIYCTSEYTTSATASAPEGLHFLSTMFKKMDSPEVNGGEIEGGKTGYTGEAGQCLASLAKVDDVEYILVTAGAPGGPSTEPYHIEDAKAVYNRIQAGEQGSAADTAADSQDDQAMTETDGAA